MEKENFIFKCLLQSDILNKLTKSCPFLIWPKNIDQNCFHTNLYWLQKTLWRLLRIISLREKCRNTEFFLVNIFPDWIRRDTRENTKQEKNRIWTFFTQYFLRHCKIWWKDLKVTIFSGGNTAWMCEGEWTSCEKVLYY